MPHPADIYKGTTLRRAGLPWDAFPNQKCEPLRWGMNWAVAHCYYLLLPPRCAKSYTEKGEVSMITRMLHHREPLGSGLPKTGVQQLDKSKTAQCWRIPPAPSSLCGWAQWPEMPGDAGKATGMISKTLLCSPNSAPHWHTTYLLILLKAPLSACPTLSRKPHLCAEEEHASWDAGCRLRSSFPGLGNLCFLSSAFYKGFGRVAETHIFCDCKMTKIEVNHHLMGRHRGARERGKRNNQRTLYPAFKVGRPPVPEGSISFVFQNVGS